MNIKEPSPEDLQRRLYFLLDQLQAMARELPAYVFSFFFFLFYIRFVVFIQNVSNSQYQMRVPIELLSGLANSLLNDTIFEIVKGLMEIQHVTEKHIFQQRLQIVKKQKCTFVL